MRATNTFVTALVLAGSRGDAEPVALSEGVDHKALVRVAGATMLERVLTALRDAGIERLVVSTNVAAVGDAALRFGAEVIPSGPGPSESVARALEMTGAPLLVTTADHPLLSPDWIRAFIAEGFDRADVAVMLARREDVEAAVPSSRRTWFRFADGEWSGCNLFLLATNRAHRAVDQWQMVESERKRPWRIAARLGWGTLLEYVLGRLSMADALARVGARAGVSAALVPAADGKAAVDVDKLDDLLLVRRILAGAPVLSGTSQIQPDRVKHAAKALFPFFPGSRVSTLGITNGPIDGKQRPQTATVPPAAWGRSASAEAS